eukprot:EG_transcript_23706
MVKVDSLVKLHILPQDGVARAERMETWEDVKESISRAPPPPPPAEEDVRLADAAHSVGGFGRLVKNKVKAAVGRGKDREEPTSAGELQRDQSPDLAEEPLIDPQLDPISVPEPDASAPHPTPAAAAHRPVEYY